MIKSGMIGDVIRIDCAASKNDKTRKQLFYELTASALTTVLNIMGINYCNIEKRVIKEGNTIEYMSMTLTYPKTKNNPELVMKRLKEENKILVKTYSGISDLGTCLRVSTGERSAMKQFLDALLEVDN